MIHFSQFMISLQIHVSNVDSLKKFWWWWPFLDHTDFLERKSSIWRQKLFKFLKLKYMNFLFTHLQYVAKIIISKNLRLIWVLDWPSSLLKCWYVYRLIGWLAVVIFVVFSARFRNENRFDGVGEYEKIASKYN